uniref:Uncharacterized protein n=1 Tax=Rhizophora mucronata TaxID=61149 RepID=A0A2P2QGI7_RHIMU
MINTKMLLSLALENINSRAMVYRTSCIRKECFICIIGIYIN